MEHDAEPVPGLPATLPPGEHILWQGAPDRRMLARAVFRTRIVAVYFLALIVLALTAGGTTGLVATLVAGAAGVGLLQLLAWATARTTLYTLTNRRVVLRIGIALPTCINLPLTRIAGVDLDRRRGDVALALTQGTGLGYAALWPHVRPWRLAHPEPMLRALPEAATLAEALAHAAQAALGERGDTPAPALAMAA